MVHKRFLGKVNQGRSYPGRGSQRAAENFEVIIRGQRWALKLDPARPTKATPAQPALTLPIWMVFAKFAKFVSFAPNSNYVRGRHYWHTEGPGICHRLQKKCKYTDSFFYLKPRKNILIGPNVFLAQNQFIHRCEKERRKRVARWLRKFWRLPKVLWRQ